MWTRGAAERMDHTSRGGRAGERLPRPGVRAQAWADELHAARRPPGYRLLRGGCAGRRGHAGRWLRRGALGRDAPAPQLRGEGGEGATTGGGEATPGGENGRGKQAAGGARGAAAGREGAPA
eukprot:scaffold9334_cov63-Phaeocystis_antarctica.AAC.6